MREKGGADRPNGPVRWWHRPAAVGLGLLVFGLIEALCVLCGWGLPEVAEDPFVGFSAVRPLFIRQEGTDRMVTAPSRVKFFPEESFMRHKAPGTFRVFCLGGSTVQGNPYSARTAFPEWLELSLKAAAPDRSWELINCGGISYASYRLANILEECLLYEPDLFILCIGHNEFLEDRTYGDIKHAPRSLTAVQEVASQLRTFNLMQTARRRLQSLWAGSAKDRRSRMPAEVDAWLDYEGGLKVYHRDEAWRRGVIEHFEFNLRRMIALAGSRAVPVVVVCPTSNLRDCPPFKSEHREGFTEAENELWERLIEEAASGDASQAAGPIQRALAIDDQYAGAWFHWGRVCEALGRIDEARAAWLKARELDVCPLRILAPMEDAMERVAVETGAPFVHAQKLISARSRHGIPGNDWLLDHVHPSIEGHQVIAGALMQTFVEQGWVSPREGWETRRDASFAAHLAALPPDYFEEGLRALEGLRAWTEGRASGPRIEYRMMRSSEGRPDY